MKKRRKKKKEKIDEGGLGDALAFEELIHKGINSGYDASVFSSIGDNELPIAKNWMEWVTDRRFKGDVALPFPRQAEIALNTFEDFCPHCSNEDYLEENDLFGNIIIGDMWDVSIDDMLSEIVFLEHGVCPKCKQTRLDFEREGSLLGINELAGAAGMRSGKSVLCGGMMTPFQVHRFLTLPKAPFAYFNLLPTFLHFNFVATTAKQAEETLWDAFKSSIDNNAWFNNYFAMLDDESARKGIELYKKPSTFISFLHKKLTITFHPANIRSKRGLTRAGGAIDELSWFSQKKEGVVANADETYQMIKKSLSTLRSAARTLKSRGHVNPPTAMMLNISSPYSYFDKLMRLIRNKKKSMFTFHYSTWEMNPNNRKEYLLEDLTEDEKATFDRDYGAIPPLTSDPAFSKELIQKLEEKAFHLTQITKTRVKHKTINGLDYKYCITKPKLNDGIPRVLVLDAGEVQNSFAGAIVGGDYTTEEFFVDGIFVCTPNTESGTKINFKRMFKKTVLNIVEGMNIHTTLYDRWESTQQTQDLQEEGHDVERFNFPSAGHKVFTSALGDMRIHFPVLDDISIDELVGNCDPDTFDANPVSYLFLQLQTVRRIGNKIIKPEDKAISDDILRAVMLGCFYIDEYFVDFHRISGAQKKILNNTSAMAVRVSKGVGASRGFNQSMFASYRSRGGMR